MDEWVKWLLGACTSLLGLLYWKHEKELERQAKNIHNVANEAVSLSLFNAHVKEDERVHDEGRESRREILDSLRRLDEKLDRLLIK
jgi:ferric iron reductase protein FhuF